MAIALLIGMPFFTIFEALSDKIGRKKIIMAGCLLAVITYFPIYHALERAGGNAVVTVWSTHNQVYTAISLTRMSADAAGTLVPAQEATNPNRSMLVFLI